MQVGELVDWLLQYGREAELATVARFPQVDGWEVVSYAQGICEVEGDPALRMDVYEADFDYGGPLKALRREAARLLEETSFLAEEDDA